MWVVGDLNVPLHRYACSTEETCLQDSILILNAPELLEHIEYIFPRRYMASMLQIFYRIVAYASMRVVPMKHFLKVF